MCAAINERLGNCIAHSCNGFGTHAARKCATDLEPLLGKGRNRHLIRCRMRPGVSTYELETLSQLPCGLGGVA
jgi:hypothetical protein